MNDDQQDQTCNVYGVDLSKPVTPQSVRDAIVECFLQAHRLELINKL